MCYLKVFFYIFFNGTYNVLCIQQQYIVKMLSKYEKRNRIKRFKLYNYNIVLYK